MSTAIQGRGGSWKAARAVLWTGNAPRLQIERRKRGRALPVGLGGLRPAAWRNSAAMAGDGGGAASTAAALWTCQRPSIGDWATELRQGVSRGVGVGGDGRVAPNRVARFCGDGWRCTRGNVGNGRLMDGPAPLDWRLGDGNAAGRFPRGVGVAGMGGLRPAAWRDSVAMGSDAHGAASAKTALWTGKRSSIGDWATETQQDISQGLGLAGMAG